MITKLNMQCFVMTARCGSITQASIELYMTRQAVSQQIRSLEEALGTKLFDRGANQLKLNHAGRAYYNVMEGFLTNIDVLSGRFRMELLGAEPVRVGVMRGLDVWGGLYDTKQKCIADKMDPHLTISILEPNELDRGLQDGTLDIAFTMPLTVMAQNATFGMTFYKYLDQVMLLAKKHPLAKLKGDVYAEALRSLPLASWGVATEKLLITTSQKIGIAPKIAQYPNSDSAFEAAKHGECFIICPSNSRHMEDEALTYFSLDFQLDYFCIWRRDFSNGCVKTFVESILANFGDADGNPRMHGPNMHDANGRGTADDKQEEGFD